MGAVFQQQKISISAGTTSGAFSLLGTLGAIVVGTTPSSRTLTVQTLDDADEGTTGWIDTSVTATTDTTNKTLIDTDAMAKLAGFTGRTNNFRLKLSASDTIECIVYSRNG